MAEGNFINGNTKLLREWEESTISSSQQKSDAEGIYPDGISRYQDVHVQQTSSDNKLKFPTSPSLSLRSSSAGDILNKVKIILSGDIGVGKSTFLRTFAKVESGILLKSETSQVRRIIKYGNKDIEVHLQDTSGQERYRSLTASYYRNANGCLVLFNFGIPNSFYNLHVWLDDIQKYCSNDHIDTVIAGFGSPATSPTPNSDLPNASGISSNSEIPAFTGGGLSIRPEVTIQQAQQFADSRGLPYVNVSSDPDSVLGAIYCVLGSIIDRIVLKSSYATNSIRPGTPESSEGCRCCPC